MNTDSAAYYSVDENLYHEIKQGNSGALKFLYKTVFPSFRNFVIKSNGSEEDAQDCFQDAIKDFYYNVCTGKHELGRARPSVTLFNYAKLNFYSLIKSARKRYTGPISDSLEPTSNDDFLEKSMAAELLSNVEKALEKLSDSCKITIIWFYLESKSLREIGDHLGISEDSAKNQRFRCIKSLKQLLKSIV
ncbi:hypothetical protein GCM10028806_35080 [Spirosoma terrae]|uniref:Sigma-70 family RNA polymerase sigma factor n=1 Tax=Spirosoma terrae TaxID=1968276 RepID=A0A6L9LED5_9BACT|nr:sigma-70 family RNA polymerase sigma factor [Spirosoma terrae]NDU97541.1 sigma-70 family RNA polymerase sigma factor [Spirosoma terrae]